jgi:hypothetical protein
MPTIMLNRSVTGFKDAAVLRLITICLTIFGVPAFADEDFSTRLPAGPGWNGETIKLPPGFAPDMSIKGVEHIRFAPGMMDPASETFFCYAFAFELQAKPAVTEALLKEEFLKYYRGLCKAVLDGKAPEVDFSKFTMTTQKMPPDDDNKTDTITRYTSQIKWVEPFATKKSQTLNVELHTWTKGEQNYVFACVSPQSKDAAVWKTLRKIRDDYLLRNLPATK